jgi:hypothetical protein
MKTAKKTDKKASAKSKKPAETKKLKEKSADKIKPAESKLQNNFIDDQEDEFGVPLDELEGFDTFNEYDDEDDF